MIGFTSQRAEKTESFWIAHHFDALSLNRAGDGVTGFCQSLQCLQQHEIGKGSERWNSV